MARYGMIIDVSKCTGCYSCFLACKDEYCGNDHFPYSAALPASDQNWMRLTEIERGSCPKVKLSYVPTPCMHCDEAPCVNESSNNAVYRRDDGIVIIDTEKAAGRKEIVSSCPYEVIYWNEERGLPQKCTLCAHLLDMGWKEPRCVETCPTGALAFGDFDDPGSDISKIRSSQEVEVLYPEYGLKPGVFYLGLPKRFIAGEVVLADQQDECAEGVHVTLFDQAKGKTLKTNDFGDFEFEGLEPNREYAIKFEHEGYTPREMKVKTDADVHLGEILLERA